MVKPCNNCPFLKIGGIRLTPRRAMELHDNATDWNGGTFACHKTTTHDDETGDAYPADDSQHCAGSLIYMLKQGAMNQMSRIAGRLGCLKPEKLMADKAVVDSVFDDTQQMVAAQFELEEPPKRKRRKRAAR
jgi:hypothetical protein